MPEGNPYDPDWTPDDDQDGFSHEGEPEDEQENEDEFGGAMSDLLSNYQEEEKEFNEEEAEFAERFGFVHKCNCAEDWAVGNLGVVSVCYLGMVTDAMDALEQKVKELKDARRDVAELRIQLAS